MAPIFTGSRMAFGAALLLVPTYSVSASTTSVNEGSSVTFTVTTTNVDNGTTLYWSTNTVSGTINTSDFSDSATTGSVTITNGSGTITRTLANDTTTEGSESFQLQIRTGSTSGTIVATSQTVTIGDTSLSVVYATLVQGAYASSTLSNGNLSWTGTVPNDVGGVSNISIPTNRKTYIELRWTSNGGGNPGPGVHSTQNTELGLGTNKAWWRGGSQNGMEDSGLGAFSNVSGGAGTGFSLNDYLGIGMDNAANSGAGEITFYRNGTAIFRGGSGWTSYTMYFHWQNNGSGTDSGTFNFGATAFQYPLSGYVGLYS